MKKISIQKFDGEDFRDLAVVFLKSFREGDYDSKNIREYTEKFKRQKEANLVDFFIAQKEENIIGLGGVIHYGGTSYIGYLGVLSEYRNEGIGSQILTKLLKLAQKRNETIQLMANIEAIELYQKFSFTNQYLCKKCKFKNKNHQIISKIEKLEEIVSWIYDLDDITMGFDRSKLLDYLIHFDDFELIVYEKEGFAIFNDNVIGPLVSKDINKAKILLHYALSKTTKEMILPFDKLSTFSDFILKIEQECLKMEKGVHLKEKASNIIGFHSFATS